MTRDGALFTALCRAVKACSTRALRGTVAPPGSQCPVMRSSPAARAHQVGTVAPPGSQCPVMRSSPAACAHQVGTVAPPGSQCPVMRSSPAARTHQAGTVAPHSQCLVMELGLGERVAQMGGEQLDVVLVGRGELLAIFFIQCLQQAGHRSTSAQPFVSPTRALCALGVRDSLHVAPTPCLCVRHGSRCRSAPAMPQPVPEGGVSLLQFRSLL